MFDMLKTATLSAMIGLGAIAAMPAAAQAEGLYFNFGDRHDDVRVGVYIGDDDRDYADYRRRVPPPQCGTCTPDRGARQGRAAWPAPRPRRRCRPPHHRRGRPPAWRPRHG